MPATAGRAGAKILHARQTKHVVAAYAPLPHVASCYAMFPETDVAYRRPRYAVSSAKVQHIVGSLHKKRTKQGLKSAISDPRF